MGAMAVGGMAGLRLLRSPSSIPSAPRSRRPAVRGWYAWKPVRTLRPAALMLLGTRDWLVPLPSTAAAAAAEAAVAESAAESALGWGPPAVPWAFPEPAPALPRPISAVCADALGSPELPHSASLGCDRSLVGVPSALPSVEASRVPAAAPGPSRSPEGPPIESCSPAASNVPSALLAGLPPFAGGAFRAGSDCAAAAGLAFRFLSTPAGPFLRDATEAAASACRAAACAA